MYRTRKTRIGSLVVLIGLLAFPTRCSSGVIEPLPLSLNETACSNCRMAISQPRYAAQIVTRDGSADFFDDIGCLVRWMSQRDLAPESAIFVADYRTGEWLAAADAQYVKSAQIPSPMGHGIVAARDLDDAHRIADETNGNLLPWEEVRETHE